MSTVEELTLQAARSAFDMNSQNDREALQLICRRSGRSSDALEPHRRNELNISSTINETMLIVYRSKVQKRWTDSYERHKLLVTHNL